MVVLEHCEPEFSYMLDDVCSYIVLVVVLDYCQSESSYMLADVCNYIVLVVVLEYCQPEVPKFFRSPDV